MKEKFECNDCHEKFEREIAAENVACCSDVICPQCSSVYFFRRSLAIEQILTVWNVCFTGMILLLFQLW